MSREVSNGLTLLTFENPAPSGKVYSWNREENLRVIHRYVIDGEPLEPEALDDMLRNPEALSFQLDSLDGWVGAAERGEDGLQAERHASARLDFMKTVLSWSIEMGNGSTSLIADRSSGNGMDGLPFCRAPRFGTASE